MKAMKNISSPSPMKAMKVKGESRPPMKAKAKPKTTVSHTEAPVLIKKEISVVVKREQVKAEAKGLKKEQSKFLGWAKYNSGKDESVAKALEVALTN
jgi:hypothetical protein